MKLIYILVSALLFSSALMIPDLFFWCALIYLFPLFYAVQRYNVTWLDGVIWAIVVYSIHWYEVGLFAIQHGHGTARYFVAPFLIGYAAIIAGLWFYIGSRWGRWILTTWLYIIIMQRFAFFIFGRVQGYPFSFPFVPLAACPQLLHAVRFMHPHLLLLLLVSGNWFLARAFKNKEGDSVFISALCFVPFLFGLIFPYQCSDHPLREKVGYICPRLLSCDMLERAGEIAYQANASARTHETISYIVTPESALPIAFNEYPEIIDVFNQNLDDDITIFLGTCTNEANMSFNSCYCITSCPIIQRYDKRFSMPFAEYVPNIWCNFDCFNRLFLNDKKIMNGNRKEGTFCPVVSPAICSDFYLDWFDHKNNEEKPLLLLVKETWFLKDGLKQLMMLAARYGALARRQHIIYVGHENGLWINSDGSEIPLK